MPVAEYIVSRVRCAVTTCGAECVVAGNVQAVFLLGWGANQDETELYCPLHHPLGEEQVLVQVQGTQVFLAIAERCDELGERHDPMVLAAMLALRDRVIPDAGDVGTVSGRSH